MLFWVTKKWKSKTFYGFYVNLRCHLCLRRKSEKIYSLKVLIVIILPKLGFLVKLLFNMRLLKSVIKCSWPIWVSKILRFEKMLSHCSQGNGLGCNICEKKIMKNYIVNIVRTFSQILNFSKHIIHKHDCLYLWLNVLQQYKF